MTQKSVKRSDRCGTLRVLLLLAALLSIAAPLARAQGPPAAGDDLSIEQARLADRFERLEQVVGRLAELSASTDPKRARLLREAIARSREEDINVRFESIVKLLEDERLSAASNNQTELQKELDLLLTLLLKADRDEQIASERERIRKYLKEVSRLIRMQKGIRARTEVDEDAGRLAKDQQQVAEDTGKLGGTIDKNEGDQSADGKESEKEQSSKQEPEATEKNGDSKNGDESNDNEDLKPGESPDGKKPDSANGKPSESNPSESKPSDGKPSDAKPGAPSESPPSDSNKSPSPPGTPSPSQGQPQDGGQQSSGRQSEPGEPQQQRPTDRATERLRSAEQKMQDAKKKLDEAERDGAVQKQREALKELELAKAELERVLRQLREEEMERTLTQLAARFRKMLEAQVAVYEGTQRLDRVPEASRDHDDEIEAAKLSRQELLIVREADKAMLVLRDEGSSVAFPEAVQQMRDDMQQVAERLAALKVDEITQGLEEDIIDALEETIAALEKELKDLEKKRAQPGKASGGQQAEPKLVGTLAELKMIRSLQMRINLRTQRYGKMITGEQAETPELLEALEDLGRRQQRVYQATYDLSEGAND